MFPLVKFSATIKKQLPQVVVLTDEKSLSAYVSDKETLRFLLSELKVNKGYAEAPWHKAGIMVVKASKNKEYTQLEELRRNAAKAGDKIMKAEYPSVQFVDCCGIEAIQEAAMEGLLLSLYRFGKYKSKSTHQIKEVFANLSAVKLNKIVEICRAVYLVRDLINEPVNVLNTAALTTAFASMGKEAGFTVKTLSKKEIEKLGMAGLLTVNKGSVDDPAFTIMEYKPAKCRNKKPIVLVGKGVVYDTGGINLKSYEGMMSMNCDMSGAAAVAGVMYALAKTKMPLHVISLTPITDNRPSGNSAVSGDIIKMMNGVTVEVMNTDAEGRLILADALVYADRYKPMLVIDIATLTGAASAAVGRNATVVMGTAPDTTFSLLTRCGEEVFERTVRFPLWDDYNKMIASKVADIKNVGDKHAGAITAGKFLEHFTTYPWIHLDIAGPAFLNEKDSYRGVGGTATGVRMIYRLLEELK
ncbi:MAG: peptidase M17 [Bacteroidetes bacterium HGW-Bacteroidetes-21]|jgi:leucyl aminopeptidase|nr:MAG: peptidase M17 [Bacteroidetes bacterium HGW-Bacteroidetes-21]